MTPTHRYWRTTTVVFDVNFCFQLLLLCVWPSPFKAVNITIAFALSAYGHYKWAKIKEGDRG